MGAFGQVTVNDAMVGKYTSENGARAPMRLRYFIGFTAAGVSVGLVAWLYEQGGFVTMLHAFAGLCLLVIAASDYPADGDQGAGDGSEQSMSVIRDPDWKACSPACMPEATSRLRRCEASMPGGPGKRSRLRRGRPGLSQRQACRARS